MPDLPTLGGPPRRRSPSAAIVVVVILVGTVGGIGVARWRRQHSQAAAAVVDAGAPVVEAPKPPPTPEEQMAKAGFKRAHVAVNGPLETGIIDAVGHESGSPLTQVVTRALVWWLEVPADFRKGDTLDILYEERPNQEPIVHAVRYVSVKLGKTYAAYRFKAQADSYPRLYQADGEELELRLKDAPLEDYEQVTSHLRDGRHHKGVDFKTPVGSKVHATFAGVVTRKTWNFRGNGNSLEIEDPSGRKALYLHLSEIPKTTHPGTQIGKNEVIGESGNTGHSFAPHLHYQLMQGEKLLDPFKVQDTFRKKLAPDQLAAFNAEVRRLDGWMGVGGT